MNSRGVVEDELGILEILDSQDTGSSCLGFAGDNGDLFTEDTIEKCRFPHIWFAKDRNETRLERIHWKEVFRYSIE